MYAYIFCRVCVNTETPTCFLGSRGGFTNGRVFTQPGPEDVRADGTGGCVCAVPAVRTPPAATRFNVTFLPKVTAGVWHQAGHGGQGHVWAGQSHWYDWKVVSSRDV